MQRSAMELFYLVYLSSRGLVHGPLDKWALILLKRKGCIKCFHESFQGQLISIVFKWIVRSYIDNIIWLYIVILNSYWNNLGQKYNEDIEIDKNIINLKWYLNSINKLTHRKKDLGNKSLLQQMKCLRYNLSNISPRTLLILYCSYLNYATYKKKIPFERQLLYVKEWYLNLLSRDCSQQA